MYTIENLLEELKFEVEIDLYERLPVPWGLVRSGVAPDHPEKKRVTDHLFNYYLSRPQVRYMGNVEIGKDVRHEELAQWYDAVIYATGAFNDTKMGIPGEDLPGSWAASEFVAWYNGHPDYCHLQFDLSTERAIVVGIGNVALDVARMLALPIAELEKTDIADHALQALRNSNIKEVVLLGRRSHLQGSFHNPELEDLEYLGNVDVTIETGGSPIDNSVAPADVDWETARKVKTLARLANRQISNKEKSIVFRFLSSPVELTGNDKVERVLIVKNRLERDASGNLRARATEEKITLDAGLVLRAIGYRGDPFPGLPFDQRKGVIENIDGRVANDGEPLADIYVTGWIKRGPKGLIGTNKQCSRNTVRHLLEDHAAGKLSAATRDADAVLDVVRQRQPKVVNRADWLKIDRAEILAGRSTGRPRVKFTARDEMLRAAGKTA